MKRTIVSALLVFVIISQTVSAFAGQSLPLTVPEAASYLSANSSDMKKNSENQYLNTEKLDSIKDKISVATDESVLLDLAVQKMQNELQSILYTDNVQLIKEKTEYTVAQLFVSIIAAEKDLSLHEENIKISLKEYNISKTKHQLGMMSDAEIVSVKNNYNKLLNEQTTKETAIAKAYVSLNQMMGTPIDNRYNLQLTYNYTPLEGVSLQSAATVASDQNAAVKSLKADLDVAIYELNEYTFGASKSTREELEISVNQASRSLQDKKQSVEASVISLYNDIKELEVQYQANQLELSTMKKQLSVKETSVKLGKMTELELEKYEYQIAQLNETIRKQIFNHNLKVQQFKNSNLL